MKKLVCALLILCFLTMNIAAVQAETPALKIEAPSAVLMHSSGAVLYEKDALTPRPIASVTKVMTLLLVFEAIEKGSLSMADTVTASSHAASMGGSQIWLEEGETFTVEEMIKAVVIASANDCAVALSEHIAGTEEAFVAMMNQRAKELQMNSTTFKNACGLDTEGHLSCALDVAVMSRELIKYQKVKEYATTVQSSLRGGEMVLDNTNKMLRSYAGLTGLKTGYTSSAGYCLSATAEREGTELIAVVLGGETSKSRNGDIAALLNWGFANYMSVVPTSDKPLMPVKVKMGSADYVIPELEQSEKILARKGKEIQKEIIMKESLKAPVEQGQIIGEMKVYQDGKELCSVPIAASCEVPKITYFQILKRLLACAFMRG